MAHFVVSWTFLLIVVVGLAALSVEYVFTSAISPSSYFSQPCVMLGFVRLPLDIPREIISVPVQLVKPSSFDGMVPFVIVALLVAASANLIKNVGLLTNDHFDHTS
ncbi:hypothetical protein LIER_35702 [Lithospermum erythrorhizon]|uniref:Uncharacterized protein n=1 Tax=Lithospermum erythrorhizon TaxID=34254 RepID=A0AAV3NWV7_LITER